MSDLQAIGLLLEHGERQAQAVMSDTRLSQQYKQEQFTVIRRQAAQEAAALAAKVLEGAAATVKTAEAAHSVQRKAHEDSLDYQRLNARMTEMQALAQSAQSFEPLQRAIDDASAQGDYYSLRALRAALPALQQRAQGHMGKLHEAAGSIDALADGGLDRLIEATEPEPLRTSRTALGEALSNAQTVQMQLNSINWQHSQFNRGPLSDVLGNEPVVVNYDEFKGRQYTKPGRWI